MQNSRFRLIRVAWSVAWNAACMMYSPPEVPKMVAITIRRNLTARQSRIA